MAKKPRPDPLEEGSLKDIYTHFFAPLIYYKPNEMLIADWMEYLFDFKNRDIVRHRARRNFTMPGLFYQAAARKIQGVGYRKVKTDDEVWVRRDARNPDSIDVEVNGGSGAQVFNLTAIEFNRIGAYLEEAERKKPKR